MSTHAKFPKGLCIKKTRIHVQKKAFLTENISFILQYKVSLKFKDPNSPSMSCIIGNHITRACVNILPFTVFVKPRLGELHLIQVVLQFADRSMKTPSGIMEDVLIQVDKFYFPIEFIVIDI